MSWERRRNGTRYYYRARKIGGRVVKEYLGTGSEAERAATQDASERSVRAAASIARRTTRAELHSVEAPLDAFTVALDSLTSAGLLLAGYYRHHGGEWRGRRDA